MHNWKDREGREYVIDINVASRRKVKAETTVDLLEIATGALAEKLSDPETVCQVLWSLSEDQAAKKSVTPEMFGQALAGDALEGAVNALLEDVIDFFPLSRRQILRKLLVKTREAEAEYLAQATAKVDGPEMKDALTQAFSK